MLRIIRNRRSECSWLAILDPEHGCQPFVYEKSVIAFNGKIYNYRELAVRYLSGTVFTGHSDTEVVLHLFLKRGSAVIPFFRRYVRLCGNARWKSFRSPGPPRYKIAVLRGTRGILRFRVGSSCTCSCLCCNLRISSRTLVCSRTGWHRYHDIESSVVHFVGTEEKAIEEIRRMVMRAVEKRLLADVTVGVSLSGGRFAVGHC